MPPGLLLALALRPILPHGKVVVGKVAHDQRVRRSVRKLGEQLLASLAQNAFAKVLHNVQKGARVTFRHPRKVFNAVLLEQPFKNARGDARAHRLAVGSAFLLCAAHGTRHCAASHQHAGQIWVSAAHRHVCKAVRPAHARLIRKGRRFPGEPAAQAFFNVAARFVPHRVPVNIHRLRGRIHVDGRVIAGKCISRPLLRIVQRSWQIPCVCRHACRVVQYRGFACALARGGFQFLRVPRVFQLLRIARERTSVHVRRQAVRGLLQRGRGLPALLVRVRHCQLLVNGHAQPACVQHPRVHVVCDIPAVGGIVCALYRALAVRAQRIVGVCVLFIPLRLPFAFGRCHLRGFLHTPPCGGKRVRPELSEALQLQIRPFVCQRRVCGLLFARGRSGFAALHLDQLHQIGRLRPAKSAGSRIFPCRARFFVAFFHTFLHLFPPFQAAFRRSRAAVIMPVQSDTPAAAPRFSRGSHIARSCR